PSPLAGEGPGVRGLRSRATMIDEITPPHAAYPAGSTSRRSTFRQPLGSTAPRCARSPRYSLRSANLMVILRSPERTPRFCDELTTAMAVMVSSPLEDTPKSLLPLPLGSAGRSFTGNARILPSLLTAQINASSDGTIAGASDLLPSGTLSTALPALLRECSSPSFTT